MIPATSLIRNRLRMRHLQLIAALADTGSLTDAAREISMTQPAATKALRELESTLGVTLFVRHARGLQPTPFGQAVIQYARIVFQDLDGLREELAAIQSGDMGRVRIGAIMARAPDILTQAIVSLQAAHPKLQISVQVDTSDVLVHALQQDQLDIVVGRIPDDVPARELSFETLSEEDLSIVARPEHPAAKSARHARLQKLAEYPWVLQPHPSPMRQIIDQTFREARVAPPAVTVETSAILGTLSLVRASDMLAVLPSSVARYYGRLNVISLIATPLRGRLTPLGLILRKKRRVQATTQLVIDAIREAKRLEGPPPSADP